MYFTDEESKIIAAFYEVMLNQQYVNGRGKRYRILFFSYMFGCIHIDDVYFIMLTATEFFSEEKLPSNRNKSRSLLNYFAKHGLLKKIHDGYYILTAMGLSRLQEHLLFKQLIPDSLSDYFCQECNKKTINTSHASVCGRMVLIIMRAFGCPFIMEPSFASDGHRITVRCISEKPVLYPDAVALLPKYQEDFYLEGDCCTERAKSSLLPKLQRYLSSVYSADENNHLSTLHFFIWNKKNLKSDNQNSTDILNDIEQLYEYLSCSFPGHNICFKDFLNSFKTFSGNSPIFSPIRQYIDKMDLYSCSSMQEMRKKIEVQMLSSTYLNKQYLTRRNTLFQIICKIPTFKQALENGNRFICTPLNYSDRLLPFIYIDQYDQMPYAEAILKTNYNGIKLSLFKEINTYTDEVTGEHFTFRNIFQGVWENCAYEFVFENISEDLSGYIRVERLLKSSRVNTFSNLVIVCIYGRPNDVLPLKDQLIKYKNNLHCASIFFLSYDDIIYKKSIRDFKSILI